MSRATIAYLAPVEDPAQAALDQVFFALSDPTRRDILHRLDCAPLLVSELAAPYEVSLQAVSRHIQVLVRAGLVRQERSGRINRCNLEAGPLLAAAVWINGYSKYWQAQFDTLKAWLEKNTVATRRKSNGGAKKQRRAP